MIILTQVLLTDQNLMTDHNDHLISEFYLRVHDSVIQISFSCYNQQFSIA